MQIAPPFYSLASLCRSMIYSAPCSFTIYCRWVCIYANRSSHFDCPPRVTLLRVFSLWGHWPCMTYSLKMPPTGPTSSEILKQPPPTLFHQLSFSTYQPHLQHRGLEVRSGGAVRNLPTWRYVSRPFFDMSWTFLTIVLRNAARSIPIAGSISAGPITSALLNSLSFP
jgi:hypothetical protein